MNIENISADVGVGGVVGVIGGALIAGSLLLGPFFDGDFIVNAGAALVACEAELPRDRQCEMVAVVKELLDE